MYLGHLITCLTCLLAVPLLAAIMRVPYAIITPLIVLISIIGAYALNNSMLDVYITVVFGLLGYWLRKMKYPLAPLVVALVLGDQMEKAFRQSLIASGGNPLVFVSSPIAATLLVISGLMLFYPFCARWIAQRRAIHSPAPHPARSARPASASSDWPSFWSSTAM